MGKAKIERRKHQRTQSTLPLKIYQRGIDDVITETSNISCSGVYCRTSAALPVMSKVGITLLLPTVLRKKVHTKKIHCNGVVVRSDPEIIENTETPYQNVAIFFTDLNSKDRSKVNEYVLQSCRKRIL